MLSTTYNLQKSVFRVFRVDVLYDDALKIIVTKKIDLIWEHLLYFQSLCGTEPHPVRFRAKKYKIAEKSFRKFVRADNGHDFSRQPRFASFQIASSHNLVKPLPQLGKAIASTWYSHSLNLVYPCIAQDLV